MTEVRPAEWKNYEDFAAGIDTNRLPATDALSGEELTLRLDDGSRLALAFAAADRVAWEDASGGGEDACEVIQVDERAYFIDMTFASRPTEALTIVADVGSGRALTVRSIVGPEDVVGEPRVGQRFVPGVVGHPQRPDGRGGHAPAPDDPPAPTRDLIGRRTLYRYSPEHVYEHVYLSSQRYAWQCLQGVQRGHGDCDMATTYRFAPGRYLFTFREFRIPVASVFFYNMDALRSTGKFLGVTGDGAIENSPAGAHIIPLGEVSYPEGLDPV